jgi:hypothetical protein
MNERLNNTFLRLTKRAEAADRAKLVDTFVDTGPMLTLLSATDHQVIFGRRGTGKTHALIYLADSAVKRGDIAVYVDMRTIGSTGGLYADPAISLSERATRLLADTLGAVHEGLLTAAVERDDLNLSQLGPILDQLAAASTDVVVTGSVDQAQETQVSQTAGSRSAMDISIGRGGPKVAYNQSAEDTSAATTRSTLSISGLPRHRVHFGAVGSALAKLTSAVAPRRLWVLIDEWSIVPVDLQPYLADLFRRSFLATPRATLKIAAIEQRSVFQLAGERGDYIGIELGADVSADLNLDDFMVFDNDAERATRFFRELLFKHYKSVEAEAGVSDGPQHSSAFVQVAFTQRNAFEELVRAAEGVPRDAINILGLSAQKALNDPISVGHVRAAAKTWYLRDKEAAVSANGRAKELLHWIIDQVIAHRRARAFLLQTGERHPLVDTLFDSRVLHLLKRSISANDRPGVRYDAYKIDYGCYVDLLTTQKSPQGLLQLDAEDGATTHIDVPPDDYRAIRRAILELGAFDKQVARGSTS